MQWVSKFEPLTSRNATHLAMLLNLIDKNTKARPTSGKSKLNRDVTERSRHT